MPINEEDIRPAELMTQQARCAENDRQFLLKRKTQFVEVSCPACDSTDHKPAFTKNEFSYATCSQCQTVYMTPRPNEQLLKDFYSSSENYAYWNKHLFPATEEARRENIFNPRARRLVDICRKNRINQGTVLEIGAGFGTFCQELQQLNIFNRIIGIEPTPDLAQTCRDRGLEIIEKPIEESDLPHNSIDAIASFEVIEHLFNPAKMIEAATRLLRPGGLLVLSCPNVRGFDIATLGIHSDTIDHEHVNYFHPTSIRILLERYDLQVLDMQTPGQLDADLVRSAALAGKIDLTSQPLLNRILLEEWETLGPVFQTFLAQNQLSGHMQTVAQRL